MADPVTGGAPTHPPRIVLVPLDERPVTARLPVLVGAVAGADVRTPPSALMPRMRVPGDADGLLAWVLEEDASADAVVVSLETLGLGGLIPSRVGHEPAAEVLRRWEGLAGVRAPVSASCVVMRTPDADDAGEEPEYYAHAGRAVYAASRALAEGRERPQVPAEEFLDDFLGRRLRNHVLDLAAVDLARRGVLDRLAVTADDTSTVSVGSREQAWVATWTSWLALGSRVSSYPGADEVGSVLVVRALLDTLGLVPTVRVHSATPLDGVPAYENEPLGRSVGHHVAAVGAMTTDGPADLELVVHPPAGDGHDHAVDPPGATDPRAASATAALVRSLLARGARVAVADCAHPNGADPELVRALAPVVAGRWERLAAFAGWNTAGNTVGSALAQGLAVVAGRHAGTFDATAHAALVRLRLLEDWGWMSSARAEVRVLLGSDPARHDHLEPGSVGARTALDAARILLVERLAELDPAWTLASVAFPWDRTYEVDLEVARR